MAVGCIGEVILKRSFSLWTRSAKWVKMPTLQRGRPFSLCAVQCNRESAHVPIEHLIPGANVWRTQESPSKPSLSRTRSR
jgi:hypothetical protein